MCTSKESETALPDLERKILEVRHKVRQPNTATLNAGGTEVICPGREGRKLQDPGFPDDLSISGRLENSFPAAAEEQLCGGERLAPLCQQIHYTGTANPSHCMSYTPNLWPERAPPAVPENTQPGE
ncbi:hypothetical protein AOLI_G00257410 [Acnodon oligacanthus]